MASFDSLARLSDRLYCISQALSYGDGEVIDHDKIIASELAEVWIELVDIIELERVRQRACEVEMEKFTQGFAYGRAKGMCAGGA